MDTISKETSKFKFSQINSQDLEENPSATCQFILANLGKLQRKDPTIITWLVRDLCLALLHERGFPVPAEDWTPPPSDAL